MRKHSQQPARALVFDLGNVLFYFDRDRAHQSLAAHYGVATDSIVAACEDSGLRLDYERGELITAEFHAAFCARLTTQRANLALC